MEEVTIQKRAFDISELPENVDLSVPPVSGLDYLYRVRLEARNCPQVVVSNIDRTQFLSRQTVTVDICNGFVCARPGFEPDPAWQKEQLEAFRTLKTDLFDRREELKEKFPRKEFPKVPDSSEWSLFCLGPDLSARLRVETKEASSEDCKVPKAKKPRLCQSGANPPLLSIVLHLNQSHLVKLLSHQIRWLEKLGFSEAQGEWLFALLVCLEKPLDPNTCALLRSLSRLCSKLRDGLSHSSDPFLRPINLILSIVAHCFDQKDMSDSFFANQP